MSHTVPPPGYYAGCNARLARLVPASARRLLEVGCGEVRLGGLLRSHVTGREVVGLERQSAAAKLATANLDQVFPLDVEHDDAPLEDASFDVILYGDVLEHFVEPLAVLRRHRRLLPGPMHQTLPNY